MDREAIIKLWGVEIGYEQIWGGTPPNRMRRPDPNHVTTVHLALSPEEWCYICMRESEGYIGPCCGNTGQIQDIMNEAFRNSGWIDGPDLLQIGINAENHEGFDTFARGMSDEQFQDWTVTWNELGAYDKLGLIYQAVQPKLRWERIRGPNLIDETDEERAFRTLEYGLADLAWTDLFSGEDEFKQRHANRIVRLARILIPARLVADQLEATVEGFEGHAIVNKESGDVITNGYGYCIYSDRAEAERVLELMTRWEREEREEGDDELRNQDRFISDKVEVRPVRVSVAAGIEVGERV